MTTYHATLKGEDGSDFSATFKARSKVKAWERVKELYPESRCILLESESTLTKRGFSLYRWHVMAFDDYDY